MPPVFLPPSLDLCAILVPRRAALPISPPLSLSVESYSLLPDAVQKATSPKSFLIP